MNMFMRLTPQTVRLRNTSNKPSKTEKRTIYKDCYMDLTNASNETMTVKVSNIYSRVER